MAKTFLFVVLVLLGNAVAQHKLPPSLDATNCSVAAPSGELPNAQFGRKGGRTTVSKVLFRDGVLIVSDVEQGRDLGQYEKLTLINPRPTTVAERKGDLLFRVPGASCGNIGMIARKAICALLLAALMRPAPPIFLWKKIIQAAGVCLGELFGTGGGSMICRLITRSSG